MQKANIFEYWFRVILSRVLREIWNFIKEHVAIALVIFCAASFAAWLSSNGLIDKAIADGYVSDASSSFRVVGALLILAFFYLLWSAVYFPAVIYNEQKEALLSLAEKWGGEKIKTEHVTLNPEEDNRDKGDLRALIRVENRDANDLTDCYASAIRVMEKNGKIWEDRTDDVNKSETELTWPAHPKEKVTIRKDGKSERVSVAHIQSGRAYFTHLRTENKVGDGLQERLYVEIEFNCSMKEKPIEPLTFKGFLVHEKVGESEGLYLEPGKLLDEETKK